MARAPFQSALLAAIAMTWPQGPAVSTASAQTPTCAIQSEKLDLPNVRLIETQAVPAGEQGPAHCLVRGRVNERTGVDGKTYAIGFEMRLPHEWSGRFLHQLNGGNDGIVVPAIGDPRNLGAFGGQNALSRGFAVLSSDSGHDGNDPANAGAGLTASNVFGLDPQARLDYGYAADVALEPVAKAIIKLHYGRRPDHSYMFGCSNGGRHVMVGAVRLAGAYDGFIAGNPGFNLPKAAVQHAWDVQSFRQVNPDIRKAFSPDDMKLAAARILDKCDALDGIGDGMVGDLRQCQKAFRVADLQCAPGQNSACLTAEQVKALERVFSGPKNSAGQQLYSDWPYDGGVGARNWRFWKLESTVPPWQNNPLIAIMGAGSLSYIFTTPPTKTEGTPPKLIDFLAAFDLDRDAPKIFATDGSFTESAMAFMAPPDVDDPKLAELKAKGHKLLVYHGQSDAVFSVNDTINWYEKLAANNGGDAGGFARLFAVPGMNHCSTGPATDNFDSLGAMIDWVEKGKAPDRIIAKVNAANAELPADWGKTRTRPLCPWPKIAKYKAGDKEQAESFACEAP